MTERLGRGRVGEDGEGWLGEAGTVQTREPGRERENKPGWKLRLDKAFRRMQTGARSTHRPGISVRYLRRKLARS